MKTTEVLKSGSRTTTGGLSPRPVISATEVSDWKAVNERLQVFSKVLSAGTLAITCWLTIGFLNVTTANSQTVEWTLRKDYLKQNMVGIELLGQVSRMTDNQRVDLGRNSFSEWEVDVSGLDQAQRAIILPLLRERWLFGVNRDAKNASDENLADHLRHGSRTAGDWGQYNVRVYIARGRILDEHGRPLSLKEAGQKYPALGAIIKNPAVNVIIRAKKIDAPSNVSGWIGDSWGGQQKEIVMPGLPGWNITAISVNAGRVVNTIWVHYVDPAGTAYHIRFGNESDWKRLPTFNLSENEGINRVTGRAGRLLDQIKFHTNSGRSSPFFGGKGGNAFDLSAPSGAKLMGIQVRCGDAIDRIRFVWGR